MISKEEVNQKLKKMGYQVVEDSSIVTVLIPVSASLKSTIKELKNKLNEMDYTASFGVKQYKGEGEKLNDREENTREPLKKTNMESEDNLDDYLKEDGEQFSLEDFGIGF